MTDALARLEEEVRDLVRDRGIDPVGEGRTELIRLVDDAVLRYGSRSHNSDLPLLVDPQQARQEITARIAGLGPLQPLMDDPAVEEIWINSPTQIFCARGGHHVLTNLVLSDAEVKDLVERMLRTSGRRLDLSAPFVDAVLSDGSRLHVVIPDITFRHWAVNIRKFGLRARTLSGLIDLGSVDAAAAAFLAAAVEAGLNILVSGATQTGKTTMLNCLTASIPAAQRVITCEEVFELQVNLPDVVSLQTRQENLEGRGAIELRKLVSEALRMRPDRIIVGEVRGAEALDLLVALNSGLPGMASIHANNAAEAITKLTTLPLLAAENVSHAFVVPTVALAVDLVIHLGARGGRRRTEEIVGISGRVEGQVIETTPLFVRDGERLEWTGLRPPGIERFRAAGIDIDSVLA